MTAGKFVRRALLAVAAIAVAAAVINDTVTISVGSYTAVTVGRVVDGDTITVDDGKDGGAYVRLIGINAPESVNPDKSLNTPEGEAASRYLKGILAKGQTVWLESDISDTDKYGRLLRYVYTAEPVTGTASDPAWVSSHMLNAMLISAGHAEAKAYPPDTKWQALLDDL
jgi:micrococcal nuclease